MSLMQLSGVTVGFGGPPVLERADLSVERGERLCLLGRNGTGKSTLLGVLQGTIEPDAGRVIRSPGVRVAQLEQRVPSKLTGTVLELVLSGRGSVPPLPPAEHVARAAISRAGLVPDDEMASLSAGLMRRALLASAWASEADVLLLDEPTNHLDLDSIAWLEDLLSRADKTLVFVTHDRALLRRLATCILELDRGRLTRHPADYDAYVDRKRRSLATEARSDALFDKTLGQEEGWLRKGVKERRKRNQGRVARLREMRDERSGRRDVAGSARMQASAAAPTGRLVLEAKSLSFSWPSAEVLTDVTTTILRGDRVGVIGPNGSGKTTLLRLLLGELPPTSGSVRHGVNLQIAYFDQLHATLDESKTAAENVGDGAESVKVGGRERHVIGYLGDFLFTPDQARSPITRLSGGERNRLLLARLFARPSNVLVLDEPTNDLDVETLQVLEELLSSYEGTILLVSHDRELLDRVVDSTLVLDDGGRVREFVGGYTDWLRQRKQERAASSSTRKKRGRARAAKPKPALDAAERKDLLALPLQIETLESKLARLHARMAETSFFQQPGKEIAAAQTRCGALEAEIKRAYARWEALEVKAGKPGAEGPARPPGS